jgi:transcriptional regulator with XRE-family HTH domain
MLDSLNVPVPSFGTLLVLGCLFLVLLYIYSLSENAQASPLKYDQLLKERLKQLGMTSFLDLQQKSGLTSTQLRQVRRGELSLLKLKDLTKLATALDWTIEELLQLGGLKTNSRKQVSEMELLRRECLQLRRELQNLSRELTTEFQHSIFSQLQTLLTNYPSLRASINVKPDLPAKNIVSLFTPLDNLIETWGYERIGQAWEQVPYNPQLHQADANDIELGELVYIRFIGYKEGEQILCPAKVSRTLPGGIK